MRSFQASFLRAGTLAPARIALERPIAIACLGLLVLNSRLPRLDHPSEQGSPGARVNPTRASGI
jgi:hypothetical protein